MSPARKSPRREVEVDVDGRHLRLSNLDKVMYPETGFTKGQVVDYYRRVAPAMLPHLEGRAATFVRFPDGIDGEGFFEKRCPPHRPDWVRSAEVPSSSKGSTIRHCVVADLPTLVWAANLASLEIHMPMAVTADARSPRAVVFDLDPGPPAGRLEAAAMALHLRDVLARLDLECFPKSSGGKGVHLYVPLNTPATYDETAPFARAVGELLERRFPGEVVVNMSKEVRGGKIFVDWSQNALHKTTVAPYSLRARDRPWASAPLLWEEVEAAVEAEDGEALRFDAATTLERVERHGDLFGPVLTAKQHLPAPARAGGPKKSG